MNQCNLFDKFTEQPSKHFPGPEYEPERDCIRLTGQQQRVFSVMSDGEWRTIADLSRLAGCPENSASSQLRQLRWEANGGHTVNKRHVGNGLYLYQLVVKSTLPQPSQIS